MLLVRHFAFILIALALAAPQARSAPVVQDVTEIKVPVDPSQLNDVKRALGLMVAPMPQTIYYLDTKNLDLYQNHVIIRVRSSGEKYQVVVKIRPVDKEKLSKYDDFKEAVFDYDLTSKGTVLAGAVKSRISPSFFNMILNKSHRVSELLTPEQKKLMKSRLIGGGVNHLDVNMLGPIQAFVWPSKSWKVELWNLPDGGQMAEVSRKVPFKQVKAAVARIKAMFNKNGIARVDSDFKTRSALESLNESNCIIQQLSLH
jgi:hypothetical protein